MPLLNAEVCLGFDKPEKLPVPCHVTEGVWKTVKRDERLDEEVVIRRDGILTWVHSPGSLAELRERQRREEREREEREFLREAEEMRRRAREERDLSLMDVDLSDEEEDDVTYGYDEDMFIAEGPREHDVIDGSGHRRLQREPNIFHNWRVIDDVNNEEENIEEEEQGLDLEEGVLLGVRMRRRRRRRRLMPDDLAERRNSLILANYRQGGDGNGDDERPI